MNVNLNAFSQNLEEQLGSTSECTWFIDLGIEKSSPLLREIEEDNFEVKVDKVVKKFELQ